MQWRKNPSHEKNLDKCFLHSSTQIGTRLIVYGGCNYDGLPLDQMYMFDTKNYKWAMIKVESDVDSDPGPR